MNLINTSNSLNQTNCQMNPYGTELYLKIKQLTSFAVPERYNTFFLFDHISENVMHHFKTFYSKSKYPYNLNLHSFFCFVTGG